MRFTHRGADRILYSFVPGDTGPDGDDTPIFFHHGVGLTSDAWWPWVAQSFPGRTLVSIEMRGHGVAADVWADGYTMDTFVGDVEAVLDAAGISKCHFIGESFGGTVGLALAADKPHLVESLTVVSTAFDGSRIATLVSGPTSWPPASGRDGWPTSVWGTAVRPSCTPGSRTRTAKRHRQPC